LVTIDRPINKDTEMELPRFRGRLWIWARGG